jgi:hypothetical protein
LFFQQDHSIEEVDLPIEKEGQNDQAQNWINSKKFKGAIVV